MVFFLQIAYNTGYVKVDWKRVEKDLDKAKEQLSQGSVESAELNTFVKKVNIGGILHVIDGEERDVKEGIFVEPNII